MSLTLSRFAEHYGQFQPIPVFNATLHALNRTWAYDEFDYKWQPVNLSF